MLLINESMYVAITEITIMGIFYDPVRGDG